MVTQEATKFQRKSGRNWANRAFSGLIMAFPGSMSQGLLGAVWTNSSALTALGWGSTRNYPGKSLFWPDWCFLGQPPRLLSPRLHCPNFAYSFQSLPRLGERFGPEKKYLAPPPKKFPDSPQTPSRPLLLVLLETTPLGFSIKYRLPAPLALRTPPSAPPAEKK